jgi:hypothetical protein
LTFFFTGKEQKSENWQNADADKSCRVDGFVFMVNRYLLGALGRRCLTGTMKKWENDQNNDLYWPVFKSTRLIKILEIQGIGNGYSEGVGVNGYKDSRANF